MLSLPKSRAGRRARSGMGSSGLSMRIATGKVCGRRYDWSSLSALFGSIIRVLPGEWQSEATGRGGVCQGDAPDLGRMGAMIRITRYRVLGWRGIPSLVEAWDDSGTVQRPLSARFQDLIDAVAMREGASDSDAYLEGWARGPEAERPGTAQEVADGVAEELEETFADLVHRRMAGVPGPGG